LNRNQPAKASRDAEARICEKLGWTTMAQESVPGDFRRLIDIKDLPSRFSASPNIFQTFSKHFLGGRKQNQWVEAGKAWKRALYQFRLCHCSVIASLRSQ
jgi:hypothetical protein